MRLSLHSGFSLILNNNNSRYWDTKMTNFWYADVPSTRISVNFWKVVPSTLFRIFRQLFGRTVNYLYFRQLIPFRQLFVYKYNSVNFFQKVDGMHSWRNGRIHRDIRLFRQLFENFPMNCFEYFLFPYFAEMYLYYLFFKI